MTDSNAPMSDSDLTRLLPTCQRCRRLRRKCDTQLPACRLCQKGKAECTFFDHALQQALPRSYVHSLVSRLSRLRSVQAGVNGTMLSTPTSYPSVQPMLDRHTSIQSLDLQPQPEQDLPRPEVSFDKHFVIKNANPTCWQFFGSSSPMALAVEVLVHGQAKFGTVTHDVTYVGTEFALNQHPTEGLEPPEPRPTPSRAEVEMLTQLYLSTSNIPHGYPDHDGIMNDIDTYLKYHGSSPRLFGHEAHQYFRIALICAIAAANKSRHNSDWALHSVAYYREGLQCLEEVTSDVSADALQALLLLILFAFFYPRRVDFWKVLDYACRLGVELNFHTETNDEFEDQRTKLRRRSLFWGLYCLERTIGQHLGRPSDLPEEIITAEYPALLNVQPHLDHPSQFTLVSHYYRLIYIRSEIFKELYMPAVAPELPRSWYEQRLDQILAWQHEFRGIQHEPGIGTMTCEMGFETSICFLFQPLLLQALAVTKETHLPSNCTEVVPRESYEASIRLVSFYNNAFHAEENSAAGRYPLTILAAFYIHQVTLTILAHCLLAVDGRLPTVTFSIDPSISPSTPISFANIYQVSASCLFLLDRVANQFPGMIGMYDIYKNLSDRVLPAMTQNGLVAAVGLR